MAPKATAAAGKKISKELRLTDLSHCCWSCSASPATYTCTKCMEARYCDRKCQTEHWRSHKPKCKTPEERTQQKKLNQDLITASHDDNLQLVLGLIAQGAEVKYHWAEQGGCTALHAAAHQGLVRVADALIAAGSEVEAVGSNGLTACHAAAQFGHVDVLRRLVLAGADVNRVANDGGRIGERPLTLAAFYGQAAAIDFLVSAGAIVDLHRVDGFAALHLASQQGKLEAVRSLIRAGADVNLALANEFGDSPIISAAMCGHAAVIKALAEAGADVNFVRAMNRSTALVMASEDGHEAAVRVLLSLGADPSLVCTDGGTAFDHALHFNHPVVVLLLLGFKT